MRRTPEDRRFSMFIRERDAFTCQLCGEVHAPNSQWLDSAHMFGRWKPSVRTDPQNAVALCRGCHQWMDEHPTHKREFFELWLGTEAFEALERRSNDEP